MNKNRIDPLARTAQRSVAALTIFATWLAFGARPAKAAAPSPKLYSGMSPDQRAATMQKFEASYEQLRQGWVDKIYPQFALDLAKYPRDGIAHRNILIVLCQFPDQKPSSKSIPRYFHNLFFSEDSTDGIISLREYYKASSRGRLIISGTVTSKWLDMPNSYAYYTAGNAGLGEYPTSAQKLAEDAMSAAYAEFDNNLSYFDNDGPDGVPSSGDDDGYIDAVAVIVPGRGGEASCDDWPGCPRLWAHESGIAIYSNCPSTGTGANCLPGLPLGGVRGFLYFLGSEYNEFPGDGAVGTWFHEFSHTLGLPDLYGAPGYGLGFFSLMALGNYLPYIGDPLTAGGPLGSHPGNLDAWSRQFLGFDDPVPIDSSGHYTLAPVTQGGGSFKVWTNGEPGTEYFLLENRFRESSDRFVPGVVVDDVPQAGMVVYHVDDTKQDNISGSYRVSVVQADALNELGNGTSYGDPEDLFPGGTGNHNLTESTTPSSRALNGSDTGIRITNITQSGDLISFDLQISTKPEFRAVRYTIDDGGGDGYADPNESDQLTLTVRNQGLQSALVDFTLSTSDPAVTITQPLAPNQGPFAPTQTAALSTAFAFTIGPLATVPHAIPFQVNWVDDNGKSGAFTFTVTAGMASGLSENFESGFEPGLTWTTETVSGSEDEWHLTTVRAKSGTKSAKAGSTIPPGTSTHEAESYADMEDAALVSPAFDLHPGSELAFDSYIDAETHGGTEALDGGRVEISLSGGPWTPLAVGGGYGYVMKFNSDAVLRGAEVFSGSPQAWRHVTADLSGYSGEAQIRFRFSTDLGNSPYTSNETQVRTYEGWYVDNVTIQPRTQSGPTPRPLAFRGGPSPYRIGAPSAGSIVFRFTAPDGLPHPELRPIVRIYDVKGRLVRELPAAAGGGQTPSEFRALWNAKGSVGERVTAGIYFAKVDIQGKSESFRLVLLK